MTSPYTAVNEVRTTRWRDKPNDEDTAVNIVSERWPRPIATVLSYASREIGPGRHERDRHARLIAAAPELLAALKEARGAFSVEYAEDGSVLSVGYDSEALRPLIALLDRAIASAESSS